MKGKVGATTSIYHARLPHQRKMERMAANLDLSREAKVRLSWLTHYKKHENASVTSRRFGISRSTLHKWAKRYAERGPRGLEDLSRAPHNRRASTVAWQTVDLICSIRAEQPAWSKHKIAVILARDHDITLSASTVGRILKRKGLYDVRKSRKRQKAVQECGSKILMTVFKRDGKLHKGRHVRPITVQGKKYLRTDENKVTADNLGELPRY